MPTIIVHRKVRIFVMDAHESIPDHCGPGDIAIVHDEAGWWTKFISGNGKVDTYDIPFKTYVEAMQAAKAAAEFGF
jgi:hypothetical protein